jgi:Tol biopolymer transport system component
MLLVGAAAWAGTAGQNGKIAFTGNFSGSSQVYVINPDGTQMAQITNLPPPGLPPSNGGLLPNISPDGQRIMFTYGTVDSNGVLHTDLYVINMDRTGLTRMTNDGLSAFGGWSPDGTRIIFAHLAPNGNNVITTMRADGKGTLLSLSSDLWDSIGGYTPDARHIVFYSQSGGLVAAAWIMDAHGANKQRLTAAALEGFPSDVSPDGQHILVGDHGNSPAALANDIFVMNLDGTGLTQLTHFPTLHHDGSASYSPDGTKIVFMSDRLSSDVSPTAYGTFDIFTMSPDGSNVTRIATGVASCPQDGNCANVSWGPKP